MDCNLTDIKLRLRAGEIYAYNVNLSLCLDGVEILLYELALESVFEVGGDEFFTNVHKRKDVFLWSITYSYPGAARLSLGKAADLAGYSKLDFIERMKLENEAIFDYSPNQMAEIFADAHKKAELSTSV